MQICRALLKHGSSNFSLTILEYCEPEKCLEREKYYIDLGSEYNTVKNPTLPPMSGRKHSDASKIIMSDAKKGITGENHHMFGRTHSEKSKTIMSDAKKGEKNPMFSKPRAEGAGSPSQSIEVLDIKNNTTTNYDSMSEAARALNCDESSIRNYFTRNQNKPYKGQYTLTKL